MKFASIPFFAAVVALSAPANATPYNIAYEANTAGVFPEDVGWERLPTGGGAVRSLAGGVLTLDGLASIDITDQYKLDRQEQLNPGAGEFFFAEWRMRLHPDSDSSDVGIVIATDNFERAFSATYDVASFFSSRDSQQVFLDTTLFHTYRLESLDMNDYSMFIDDELAYEGFFAQGSTQSSLVRFGDRFIGGASASEWDYFRFGVNVVPEPSSLLLFVLASLPLLRGRRRTL